MRVKPCHPAERHPFVDYLIEKPKAISVHEDHGVLFALEIVDRHLVEKRWAYSWSDTKWRQLGRRCFG